MQRRKGTQGRRPEATYVRLGHGTGCYRGWLEGFSEQGHLSTGLGRAGPV